MYNRRSFFRLTAGLTGAVVAATNSLFGAQDTPSPIKQLKPMLDGIVPIRDEERWGRIAKAQQSLSSREQVPSIIRASGRGSASE